MQGENLKLIFQALRGIELCVTFGT